MTKSMITEVRLWLLSVMSFNNDAPKRNSREDEPSSAQDTVVRA